MPRPRFSNLDPEKRKAILDAAAEEFAAHGYEGASYNKIIEKAGISKGAMYYYFDDKNDLFATVVQDRLDPLIREVQEFPDLPDAETFWELAHALVRRSLDSAERDPVGMGLFRSLMKLRFADVDNPVIKNLAKQSSEITKAFLTKGQKAGAVREDLPFDLLAHLVRAMDEAGDQWFGYRYPDFKKEDIEWWSPVAFDLFRRLVEPASPGLPKPPNPPKKAKPE